MYDSPIFMLFLEIMKFIEGIFVEREKHMVELTRLSDVKFTINAEIIEMVEETPDTVITLTTGKKVIVKESRSEVTNLVIAYKKAIYCGTL